MNLYKRLLNIFQILLGLLVFYSILVVIIQNEIERSAVTDIAYFLTIVDILKGGFIAITSMLIIIYIQLIKNKL